MPLSNPSTSAGSSTVSSVDDIPANPDSFNDEFTGSINTSTKWTWVNQGTTTGSFANDTYLLMDENSHAGDQIRFLAQTVDTGSWTITSKVKFSGQRVASINIGMGLRDSVSSRYSLITLNLATSNIPHISVSRYTNNTTFSTRLNAGSYGDSVCYMRIVHDGTNLSYQYSNDGTIYHELLSESRTAFLTNGPDQAGLMINSANGRAIAYFDYIRKT